MPFGKHNRLWKGIAIVSVAGLAATGFGTYQNALDIGSQATDRDRSIRESQIENCVLVGEPLRTSQIRDAKQTISDIKEQRRASKSVDYHELFPNFDRKELKRLIQQGKARDDRTIEAEQAIIDSLQSAPPCDQRYPPVN